MGDLKTGDLIIITNVLLFYPKNQDKSYREKLINSVHKISEIDWTDGPFPFKIEAEGGSYWVEGVPYSPLMVELV